MAKHKKDKIIVIVGPTASGKSDLGIFLAKNSTANYIRRLQTGLSQNEHRNW